MRNLAVILVVALCALNSAAQEPKATDDQAIREAVKQMEQGWNTKSGALFAKPFAEDADYIVINGMHLQGRDLIAKGHQQIFDTIFKNSSLNLSVKKVRHLRPDVAIVHVTGRTRTKQGDGYSQWGVILTLVMARFDAGWRIVSFQNTQIADSQAR